MPKQAQPHFDAAAILSAVQQQDVGLRVSTNNPKGLQRILYQAMRAAEHLRCHIYRDPRSPKSFLLTKMAAPLAEELPEEP